MVDPKATEARWRYLEDAGYEAGLAGKDVYETAGWSEAWREPGVNLPIYIFAGWIAGRAMRRIRQETGIKDV